jgi:hypothetical protein
MEFPPVMRAIMELEPETATGFVTGILNALDGNRGHGVPVSGSGGSGVTDGTGAGEGDATGATDTDDATGTGFCGSAVSDIAGIAEAAGPGVEYAITIADAIATGVALGAGLAQR